MKRKGKQTNYERMMKHGFLASILFIIYLLFFFFYDEGTSVYINIKVQLSMITGSSMSPRLPLVENE